MASDNPQLHSYVVSASFLKMEASGGVLFSDQSVKGTASCLMDRFHFKSHRLSNYIWLHRPQSITGNFQGGAGVGECGRLNRASFHRRCPWPGPQNIREMYFSSFIWLLEGKFVLLHQPHPVSLPLQPVCDFFSASRTELNSLNGDHLSHKTENIYNLALYRKSVPTLLLDTQEIDVDWRLNDWINGLLRSHDASCLVLWAIFTCEILRAGIEPDFPFLAPAQSQQVFKKMLMLICCLRHQGAGMYQKGPEPLALLHGCSGGVF